MRENGRKKIAELSERLGIEFVIVDDMSNADYSKLSKRKQRAKGWYDRSSGKLYIQLDAHGTSEDIVRTILHEAVAHKGLRELFGDSFDTFLDNVYANADAGIRREIARMAVEEYGGDFRVATEEYLARLAESTEFDKPQNRALWSRVKEFFLDVLREVGIIIPGGISDNDLRYILWRSFHRMEEQGVLGAAEDVVMREKLDIDGEGRDTAAPRPTSSQPTAAESELSILWPSEDFGERLHGMDDGELLDNITESDGWDFYSQEYDSRHQQDYNEATDRYKAQFESMDEDGVRDAYGEARARWDAGGYHSTERSELRAMMDMASMRLDELEGERWEREDMEDDDLDGGGGVRAVGSHYSDVLLDDGVVAEPGAGDGVTVEQANEYVNTFKNRYGIPDDFATVSAVDSEEALERLIDELGLDDEYVDFLRNCYQEEDLGTVIRSKRHIIVFTQSATDLTELDSTMWHEAIHIAYTDLSEDEVREFTDAIVSWLSNIEEGIELINYIKNTYREEFWATEYMAHAFEIIFNSSSFKKILLGKVASSYPNLRNFVGTIIQNIYHGQQERAAERYNPDSSSRQEDSRGDSQDRRTDDKEEQRGVDAVGGTSSHTTGDAEDALFRDGDFTGRDREVARDAYERMVSSGGYQFQEAVQDSMLGLKRLMQSILGKKTHVEDLVGFENAYLAENRMSSVNAAEQHEYYIRYMKPLLEEIHKLCGRDENAREVLTDYMMAKHGLERNLVLAERDAREVEAAGGNYQEAYNKNREKDYSGLTALTGEDDVAAAEAVAQQMVDDYERDHEVAELWAAVNAATDASLAKVFQSGLLTQERYDAIRQMFQYYIPLQGWDETTSDEVYGYVAGHDRGMGGNVIKRAEGRRSKADDPIATIAMQADACIRQGSW